MTHISNTAKIGENTSIGINTIVMDNVEIGRGGEIGNNVVIHPGVVIGSFVRVDDNAVIGKRPMKAVNSATTKLQDFAPARIGDYCSIGTSVVIYTGSVIADKVLVADQATVRENVTIGEGTIVGRGVAIENFCKIGSYCKLETNVYLTAYSEVEDRCFLAPCVATSNDNFVGRTKERFKHFKGVTLRKGGRIGTNATILPGKIIGEDALVAAGALVTKDLAPRKIFAGLRKNLVMFRQNNFWRINSIQFSWRVGRVRFQIGPLMTDDK
jgi:UDP-2-acetamido-3-amino-2,3-dideoxy-glucuronate N-acetyltransferase